MLDKQGRWLPDLSPKGYDLFNSFNRYILVEGPRKTGKSISCAHRLVRHAYEIPDSVIGIVARTLRTAKSGFWTNDLIKLVIPTWCRAGIGFEITKEPSMTADSKMSYFRVSNKFGGESEFQLHSLDYTLDAEEKFKSTRFSAVYISEADQFEDPSIMDVLSQQLRMPHVPFDLHQMILDTNPPEDGQEHWLWNKFFDPPSGVVEEFPDYFQDHKTFSFRLEDNPFISDREKDDLKRTYRAEPNKYARYVEGKWTKDPSKTVFGDVWLKNIHVVGDAESQNPDDWDYIVPPETSFELVTGWDLGDVNHAACIIAPREIEGGRAFDIIDELVFVKERISIRDFTKAFIEKMDYWEQFMKDEYKREGVLWRHWSDSSAMRFRAVADSYDELEVRKASGGRIVINSAPKFGGMVGLRVSLAKKMLFDKRLFVSAQLRNTISMFEGLKKGRGTSVIDPRGSHKHIFDAITYALSCESPMDLQGGGRVEPRVTTGGSIELVR